MLLLVEYVNIDGALLRIPTFAPFREFSITIHSSLLPIVSRHPALWLQQTVEPPTMSEGVAATRTCAHSTINVSTSVGRKCSTPHPSQSSPYGVHPHLSGDVHSPSELLALKTKDLVPPRCATAPMSVGRDRMKLQCLPREWVGLRKPALASMSQQAPWTFTNHVSGARINRVRDFRILQEEQTPGQWHHSLPRPLPNKLETLPRLVEVSLTKRFPRPAVRKRTTRNYFVEFVRWIWILVEGIKSCGFASLRARHKVWSLA